MLQRWVSLYFLYFLVIGSFYPVFLSRYPNIVKEIPIDPTNRKFNTSKNPIWVAQMSDLHISPIYNESLQRVKDTFRYIPANINPSYLLLTGDITDNLDTPSVFSAAYPHEAHFRLYQQIREQSGIDSNRLIEILGNHDTWGRINFDNYFKYFVNGEKMKKNFYVQTYSKGELRVIGFCPIHFPTGHTTYLFVLPMYSEMLDALEEALEEPTDAKYTIFSMHFTIGMMCPLETVYSTRTKRNLKQILSDPKYNVVAIINGHTHPNQAERLHYGSTIELTSTALLVKDGFNVFSIDNDRINYQTFFQNDTMPAMVTCPTPDEASTRIFRDNDFQVRIVSFNSKASNFDVEIDRKIRFKLSFDRSIEGGSSLYSYNVQLENGQHHITISGDLNQSFNFSVSQKAGPFSESKSYDLKGWVMIVWFIFISLYQLIVLCSVFCPYVIRSLSSYCDSVTGVANEANDLSIFTLLFSGPVITGYLLRRLPKFEKMFMIFVTVSPYVLPVGIEIVEGKIGCWFFGGVFLDGKVTYDAAAQLFALFYFGYIVAGFQFLFCLVLLKKDFTFIFDFLCNLFLVAFGCKFWLNYGDDVNLTKLQRITFHYHLIPFVSMIVLSLFYLRNRRNNNNKQKSE